MTAEEYMQEAIREAERAARHDEVPVGCVIVRDGKIIARGRNLRETKGSAEAHAEIVAIRRACRKVGRWRLTGCDLYVTLEPCAMCAGAIVNARIDRVFFGAFDKRFGACGTVYNIPGDGKLNHTAEVTGGILEQPCARLLSEYFAAKRKSSKSGETSSKKVDNLPINH